MKKDGSIKNQDEFKLALAPYQQKITDAESKLVERTKSLEKFQRDLTKAQMGLTDLIKQTSESGTKMSDGVVEAKAKFDGLNLVCFDLENNVIPSVEKEIAGAKNQLASEVQNLLKNYKQSFKERMDVAIEAGLGIGVDWINFGEKLLTDLNLRTVIPYWEIESLLQIIPNMGKDLNQGYKRLIGLG